MPTKSNYCARSYSESLYIVQWLFDVRMMRRTTQFESPASSNLPNALLPEKTIPPALLRLFTTKAPLSESRAIKGMRMDSRISGFVPSHPQAVLRRKAPVLRCTSFSRAFPVNFPQRNTRISSIPSACTPSADVLSLAELQKSVTSSVEEATSSIEAAETLQDVEKLRVAFLGKKGSITTVMKSVGRLPAEERPLLGAVVNKAKNEVSELITQRKETLEEEKAREEEEEDWIDVTMPGIRPREMIGRIHPLNSTMDLAIKIFTDLGYDLIDDLEYNREIETEFYCFDALNCPADHPAREMQDTFYITEDKGTLLRTQTSAVQIRYMEKNPPPLRIIAPGRVYRRDTVDATHTPVFHQIEILCVEEYGKLNFGSLRATVIHFLKKMLGDDIETRFRASFFPFTEPSAEVDVYFKGKWLEVLGCGMVDPSVLESVGLDPEKWSGFAAGFGVERFAMVMHEVTDIRDFYKGDLRFLQQFMID